MPKRSNSASHFNTPTASIQCADWSVGATGPGFSSHQIKRDIALSRVNKALCLPLYNRPFDANHYPWEKPNDEVPQDLAASSVAATDSGNNKAEGHKQDKPAGKVVTSAHSTIEPAPPSVKPEHPPAAARPHVDFAFLRQQISLEQVLQHLDLLGHTARQGSATSRLLSGTQPSCGSRTDLFGPSGQECFSMLPEGLRCAGQRA